MNLNSAQQVVAQAWPSNKQEGPMALPPAVREPDRHLPLLVRCRDHNHAALCSSLQSHTQSKVSIKTGSCRLTNTTIHTCPLTKGRSSIHCSRRAKFGAQDHVAVDEADIVRQAQRLLVQAWEIPCLSRFRPHSAGQTPGRKRSQLADKQGSIRNSVPKTIMSTTKSISSFLKSRLWCGQTLSLLPNCCRSWLLPNEK